MLPIDKPTPNWSNTNMNAQSERLPGVIDAMEAEEMNKVFELLALDEGQLYAGPDTVFFSTSRDSVTCSLVDSTGEQISHSFPAEVVNRKIDTVRRVATQQATTTNEGKTIVAIDYKARSRKSAETRAKNKAAQSRPAKKAKTEKVARAKKTKTEGPCLCGCGETVFGRFLQGHDAKLHSAVKTAEREGKKLAANVRKLAADYIYARWPKEAKNVL